MRFPEERDRSVRSFRRAAGLTVLGAVVPGAGLLAAGRRRAGAAVLVVFLLLLGGAVWLATAGRRTAVRAAVDPQVLLGVMVGVGVLAVLWAVVVVAGYRLLLPRRASRLQQGLGAVLVALLVAAVAVPAVTAVRLAGAQRGLVDTVFADGQSATVQEPADPVNPFGEKKRVNVLLLGGDGGEGRDGVRTDTVIVASIDTDTGDTTLFSLPRNLEDLPFPAGTELAELFPDGFDAGSESESLLNAVYRNGPALYPDALGAPTDNPGADWLKLGVGEALGLPIDYYVLVNLDGFSQLVDALGGITVNVNYYVPVGGIPNAQLPDSYIAPGPTRRWTAPPRWPTPAAASASPTTSGWTGSAACSTRSSPRPTRSPCSPATSSSPRPPRTSSPPTSRSRCSTTSSTWPSWSRTPTSAASSSTTP